MRNINYNSFFVLGMNRQAVSCVANCTVKWGDK